MTAPGGFIEACTSTATRPRPAVTLPHRGRFTFPDPYNTIGIRLTNEDDGPVLPCGYSYWNNINAHAGQSHLLVFLGTDRNQGGLGPSLWYVDKATDEVTSIGPLFPLEHPLSWSTGEGWRWSATDPDVLYVTDTTRLYRYHVSTRELETVINVTGMPQHTDEILWQWHTAHTDRIHSATVKAGESGGWQPLGTIVYQEGESSPWRWYPRQGDLDESQIDKSGDWLLIKENLDAQDGEDNRMIRIADGTGRVLMDRQGAAGHSDNGFGYMVAADNWHDKPNAIRLWMFDGTEPQGRVVYYSPVWDVELNHMAHGNARPGSPDGQFIIGSGATDAEGPRANEVVAVALDGSLRVLVIAPTMTAPGAGYDDLPKANVDPSGDYALWTANGHGRRDAFLVRIPQHLLVTPPDPEIPVTPQPPRPTWRIEGWGPMPIITPLP